MVVTKVFRVDLFALITSTGRELDHHALRQSLGMLHSK
jgi:hypothetical protein